MEQTKRGEACRFQPHLASVLERDFIVRASSSSTSEKSPTTRNKEEALLMENFCRIEWKIYSLLIFMEIKFSQSFPFPSSPIGRTRVHPLSRRRYMKYLLAESLEVLVIAHF